MTKLIEIDDLSYRPESLSPEQPDILCDISLEVEAGAFVAIIGKNGSGKTTLIKHINGLLTPTKGSVRIQGKDTRQPENRRFIRAMVGMVFQNPADQIVASTVEEDVAFGLENDNLPTVQMRARVAEQLDAVDLTADATRPPHLLSGGQIQKLALAGVLARQPRLILFDEPTSMLDPKTRHAFLNKIRELHQKGMTILYVTHHMEEAVFADQIIVLDKGQVVLKGTPLEIFKKEEMLREIGLDIPETVGFANGMRALGWIIPDNVLTPEVLINALPHFEGQQPERSDSQKSVTGQKIILMRDVHYTYLPGTPLAKKALQGATLSSNANQIHGIAGTNGSGKSTLLQHINGILRPFRGQVHVASFELENETTSLREVIKKVGMVFQSPETQFFEVFVGDEIAYGPKQLDLGDIRERVRQAMAMVGLDFDAYKDRRLETLSGGEKRKVALASTLVLDQQIMLFDEPTAGMDPQARDDLLALFKKLCAQGKTILIASHRLDELASVAKNLSIMHGGKIIHSGPTEKVMTDLPALTEAGLEPPLAVRISHKLLENGWPIADPDRITFNRLLRAIKDVIQ